jgi:hypothetical protein
MNRRATCFRTSIFLLFVAIASPSILAAGDREVPRESSLAVALWNALVRLVPVLGGAEATASPEKPDDSTPDLGPGLDPAG